MQRLPDQPTAKETREYAGLTEQDWDTVFAPAITEAARKLREEFPNTYWKDLPQKKKEEVHESVNNVLAENNVKKVDLEVVGKRVSRSLARMKHDKTKAETLREKAPSKAAAVVTSAERARPYDPVRDL